MISVIQYCHQRHIVLANLTLDSFVVKPSIEIPSFLQPQPQPSPSPLTQFKVTLVDLSNAVLLCDLPHLVKTNAKDCTCTPTTDKHMRLMEPRGSNIKYMAPEVVQIGTYCMLPVYL